MPSTRHSNRLKKESHSASKFNTPILPDDEGDEDEEDDVGFKDVTWPYDLGERMP